MKTSSRFLCCDPKDCISSVKPCMCECHDGALSAEDALSILSPFSQLAQRIETNTHPDGVAVDVIMSDGAPKTFRIVSVTPATSMTIGLKTPVVEVKPPWISNAR